MQDIYSALTVCPQTCPSSCSGGDSNGSTSETQGIKALFVLKEIKNTNMDATSGPIFLSSGTDLPQVGYFTIARELKNLEKVILDPNCENSVMIQDNSSHDGFTLEPGTYHIEGYAPARKIQQHRIELHEYVTGSQFKHTIFNENASVPIIVGTTTEADNTSGDAQLSNNSFISGIINVVGVSKTYILVHRLSNSTQEVDELDDETDITLFPLGATLDETTAEPNDLNVYSTLKITKLK